MSDPAPSASRGGGAEVERSRIHTIRESGIRDINLKNRLLHHPLRREIASGIARGGGEGIVWLMRKARGRVA
ncbi:beta-glucosidase [Histoplasma capsulatum var. duboisii H88]|uniref:Beta-glucosidase n=2 Tax=Ajellomyces capsulatus TaxID=5037 RepID=A0A8H7YZS9_AJECA|nr:beta-glucosidase [Histoplasma capsulatum]QSS57731.1 beta-glucosidase [Histoplasma capsulatum var. duboisii H88]QSS67240.1 beta-glucosidase [Histoplasma capsulatum G186AR]